MMNQLRLFGRAHILFALMALTITGCTVTPRPQCDFRAVKARALPAGPVLVPLIPGSVTPMPLNAVNITDIAITNKVVVQSTNAKRLQTGDVEVFARWVNCTDYPLQVEARTHFLDAAQADAEPVSAWSRRYLPARSVGGYSQRSTAGGTVESYLIELREGR